MCCNCEDPVAFFPSFCAGVVRIGGSAGQEATFQASRGTLDSRGLVRRERVMPKRIESKPQENGRDQGERKNGGTTV